MAEQSARASRAAPRPGGGDGTIRGVALGAGEGAVSLLAHGQAARTSTRTLAEQCSGSTPVPTLREFAPKSERTPPTFYEQDTMRRLIDAAGEIDARTHALVLLGLHAGLRRSELLGLE
jgi:integrase